MALRVLLLLLGVVEAAFPRRLVDFWMNLAAAGEDPVELKPWVYTAARVEGVVIVLWSLSKLKGSAGDGD